MYDFFALLHHFIPSPQVSCINKFTKVRCHGATLCELESIDAVQAAPEVINAGYYTTACDVWSLGILLYRMLFGREPFSSFQEAADGRVPVPFPEDAHRFASQDAIDLITWMLKHDMHGRPSLQQVCGCQEVTQ